MLGKHLHKAWRAGVATYERNNPDPRLNFRKWSKDEKSADGFFCVTRIRSPLGLPQKTRHIFAKLRLKKQKSVAYHPQRPYYADLILKIKECVRVRNVDAPPGPFDPKARQFGTVPRKKAARGFTVVDKFKPGEPVLGLCTQ